MLKNLSIIVMREDEIKMLKKEIKHLKEKIQEMEDNPEQRLIII